MTEQSTKQECEILAQRLRAVQSRYTVAQVVDQPVSSQNPRGWSVQLLDTHTHNLPAYVSSWQEWETLKAQLLA